ncbi:MAG: isochorismate synthase [Flavobacteriaceae bacterium]
MNLRNLKDKESPFVVYRKPGETSVFFIESCDTFNREDLSFVFAPFDSDRHEVLEIRGPVITLDLLNTESVGHQQLSLQEPSQSDEDKYEFMVAKAVKELQNSEVNKVVLSRKESHELNLDKEGSFTKLLSSYPQAMVYWFYHPKSGHWQGASPELLVKTRFKTLETVSLAGTQAFNGEINVKWGEKEIEEQAYVSEYIRSTLEKFGYQVNMEGPQTVRAGLLLHLKSFFMAKSKQELNLSDLLESLHPTPAVCGVPLKEAQELIKDLEDYDRSYYTGYLGEIAKDSAELYVNLRCMKIEENAVHIYVGGGLTKDSDPKAEFHETCAKTSTMKKVLG